MAPEIIGANPRYTKAVDVYAFGVTANEVMSRRRPFAGKAVALEIFYSVRNDNARPAKFSVRSGDGIAAEVQDLIERAWNRDLDERPVIAAISMALKRMAGALGTDPRKRMPALSPLSSGHTSPPAAAVGVSVNDILVDQAPNSKEYRKNPDSKIGAPPLVTLDQQREILMDLYRSTGGDRWRKSWKKKDNWGSRKPLSRWFGVICDQIGNVVQLQLSGNNLTGA